ncbi:putative WRKY transcription factor 52 [Morella rubra]|uniref:Putative WRKY transcription factor 52 n=1 Tax=Morella rubra TaxID=262757 RepID=A0A6A1WU58_9ROSI|nr:putative WRKY transcription factor 52 [Morella rubra]
MDIVENFSKLHDKYLCSMLWPRDLLRSMPTNELRVMDWLGFPLKSLPTNFHSDHLVQLNMPCSRIKQLWKGIKSMVNTCPVRGIEMMSDDSIGAFYIDYAGRLYCVRNLGEESDYFYRHKVVWYVALFGIGLPEWCDIRSTNSCITLKIHEDSDDNSKWFGYFHVVSYEAHEHEKSNSRSFDGTRLIMTSLSSLFITLRLMKVF